jgi:hypothetical protein
VPSVAFDSLNSLLGAVISPEDDFPSVALMSLIDLMFPVPAGKIRNIVGK